jgi:RNA polymerase sigma factor (sigma-70 family)
MLKFIRHTTPEHRSDEQLLSEYVRQGNSQALGILYERYMPMVYGVCLKVLKDTGKAEDATMAIYEELVRKVKDHEINAFRGWLYVLSRNFCLMELRKKQRQPTHYLAPEEMARFDDLESAIEYELPQTSTTLEKCLSQLTEEQRVSVQWFYYEDKSYKEIAEIISEEVGKVRSFIQNARRNLKICMEK